MVYKLRLLITELKEEGLIFTMRRAASFIFRPVINLIRRNRTLFEFYIRIFPKIRFYPAHSGLVSFSRTVLVEEVRKFWYSNIVGNFNLDGEKISRRDIFVYGGPNPKFTCLICQKSEWLSRVRQKNLFISHSCNQLKEVQELCSRQGDELWTNFHQNFNFSISCETDLPAPKALCIIHREKEMFFNPRCEILTSVLRRQLAYTSQIDIVERPIDINWSDYDFLFIVNDGNIPKFSRPNIPIIMYGHDWWPIDDKGRQWAIDWLRPDIFLTPYPTQWQENFKMPLQTKVDFDPLFDSLFFARPNLGKKELDLLVIGATTSVSVYQPRIDLDKQISSMSLRYKIEFSHSAGDGNTFRQGGTLRQDARSGKPIRLLNKWSEYIGSSRYVIFGRMKYPVLTMKHYETLGSGAIPIFPEVPDLKYLGVRPFNHYIPLSEIENNNQKLTYFLDNYEKYRYIAENAVNWYKENSDKMIFNDFEKTIREATHYKYPKRLI